jgi:hypothetical protein
MLHRMRAETFSLEDPTGAASGGGAIGAAASSSSSSVSGLTSHHLRTSSIGNNVSFTGLTGLGGLSGLRSRSESLAFDDPSIPMHLRRLYPMHGNSFDDSLMGVGGTFISIVHHV